MVSIDEFIRAKGMRVPTIPEVKANGAGEIDDTGTEKSVGQWRSIGAATAPEILNINDTSDFFRLLRAGGPERQS